MWYTTLDSLLDFNYEPFSNGLVYIERVELVYDEPNDIVSLHSMIETIESGSRPVGGVSEIMAGIGSIGGEHIDRDLAQLDFRGHEVCHERILR